MPRKPNKTTLTPHGSVPFALASYLTTIDADYEVHVIAFVAASFMKPYEPQYCQETDVPTVPMGILRLIMARASDMDVFWRSIFLDA